MLCVCVCVCVCCVCMCVCVVCVCVCLLTTSPFIPVSPFSPVGPSGPGSPYSDDPNNGTHTHYNTTRTYPNMYIPTILHNCAIGCEINSSLPPHYILVTHHTLLQATIHVVVQNISPFSQADQHYQDHLVLPSLLSFQLYPEHYSQI